ncbi:unnamed protein product [Thlaspi arvense]|uniref:SWIM-type domain-containing protein n=1 Tax=Thlaspi arvense TaxID=13288 RepID=A0AAU9TBA6_THLAR|nr:unnamed protein product [Thlaspi arvense]
MGDDVMLKLRIQFGGTMKKENESYSYVEKLGTLNVNWKQSETTWERFESFLKNECHISTPIRFIWYKEVGEEMKSIDYAIDTEDLLCLAAKKLSGELDVFIDHECSEHIPGYTNTYLLTRNQVEDMNWHEDDIAAGYEGGQEDEEDMDETKDSDDDDIDRPKEDEEPEESEDEINKSENVAENQCDGVADNQGDMAENQGDRSVEGDEACEGGAPVLNTVDEGDEVVVDAGDGRSDARFKEVFEEGTSVHPEKEASSSVYEVVEFGCGYTVNLSTHQCACKKWDLTGIPCKYAVCVLDDNREDPVLYVAEYYYTHVLKNTYKDNIKPINTNKPPIGIPDVRKPRGRPKNRDRIMKPFESLQNAGKATRHGRIPHCSRCGQAGYINRGCENEPVVVEGPKNKRGRPRKHPAEVNPNPKPPPKPRKKHAPSATSSQAVETSSQPAPPATSSQAEQTETSSAPQASASSSQPPKPHAKKAPRGKPLKIRKTGNIPHGIGTLWSPFTDRPFKVFGNRFYDRSTSNPQPPEE